MESLHSPSNAIQLKEVSYSASLQLGISPVASRPSPAIRSKKQMLTCPACNGTAVHLGQKERHFMHRRMTVVSLLSWLSVKWRSVVLR